MKLAAIVALLIPCLGFGQAGDSKVTFEVVSVKPAGPGTRHLQPTLLLEGNGVMPKFL
jgi:hypothetical protein